MSLRCLAAILVPLLLWAAPAAAQTAPQAGAAERIAAARGAAQGAADDFNTGSFDNGIWELCQADARLLRFERTAPAEGEYSLAIGVDAARRGEVPCREPLVADNAGDDDGDDTERLGPSLVASARTRMAGMGAFRGGAAGIIQRNELRLHREYRHPVDEEYWYGLSFRVDGDIPATGSTRWVIGQWKQTRGSSPIVAQRFDNGVFHVTVQDGPCRCRVAAADGDPDLKVAALGAGPPHCVWTADGGPGDRGGGLREGEACDSELTVSRGEESVLPDPKAGWVDMIYAIRGGRDGHGKVDIYANGRFVARVTGPIGYGNWRGQKVKFKIGMYRDLMPGTAHLHVDRFWFGRDPAVHAPGFAPQP